MKEWIKNVLSSKDDVSSKRIIAIFTSLVLLVLSCFIVLKNIDLTPGAIIVVKTLATLICGLLGIAGVEKVIEKIWSK